MFLSAVSSTSRPARSAYASNSPLLNVSHPRSRASVTEWPASWRPSGDGVLWSNRMRIERGSYAAFLLSPSRRFEVSGDERQHLDDLFLGNAKPLGNLEIGRAH